MKRKQFLLGLASLIAAPFVKKFTNHTIVLPVDANRKPNIRMFGDGVICGTTRKINKITVRSVAPTQVGEIRIWVDGKCVSAFNNNEDAWTWSKES